MEAVKNFFGLGASTEGQAGAPVPPPAVTPASRPAASAAANKLAALAPASANAPAKKTVTLPTTGGMSDFIGGRRKNLRKKYKMPGRRSTRRANRKTAAARKGRKATRKNRKGSRKARN